MFSLIAQRRLCVEMISHNDYEIVGLLHKYSLGSVCFRIDDSKIRFNGDYIKPQGIQINEESQRNILLAYHQCLAKVGICYFMKLLVAEYSRDPSNKVIRKIIVDLYMHDKFKSMPISSAESKSGLNELFAIVKQVN